MTGKPIHLGITVAVDKYVYDYDFSILGKFFVQEAFKVNSITVFQREGSSLSIAKTPKTLSYYDQVLKKHLHLTEKLFEAKGEQLKNRLFLTSLFSCYIVPDVVQPFLNYITNKIMFFDDSKFELARRKQILSHCKGLDYHISSTMQEPTDILIPMLKHCMEHGICLVVGENNTSFDPLMVIPYLKAMHNINLNRDGQLLMFTYQPLYMNKYLIRRDEVSYIDQINNTLKITNLSQYAVREENYLRKYLLGEYIDTYNYRSAVKQQDVP